MSLFSILSSTGASTGNSTLTDTVAAAVAKAKQAQSKGGSSTATASPGTSTGSGATITSAARIAAAQTADIKKDATALAKELRKTLDAQYKKGTAKTAPDLADQSGRALAVIALNSGKTFSSAEVQAAKAEMKQRDRNSVLNMMSGGLSADGLTDYLKTLVSSASGLSSEERQLRGPDGLFKG